MTVSQGGEKHYNYNHKNIMKYGGNGHSSFEYVFLPTPFCLIINITCNKYIIDDRIDGYVCSQTTSSKAMSIRVFSV